MNCKSCGAAMELIAARGYYFCRYCGAFHFPETTADEGVRVLGDPTAPLSCPVCSQPLAAAMLDERFPAHYCSNCRGLLIPMGKFADLVRMRRGWANQPPAAPTALDPRELQRSLACPTCRRKMATHPYYGPGNVVIDSCDTCNVVWLDFGELKRISAAPGKDRGVPEVKWEPEPQSMAADAQSGPAQPEPPSERVVKTMLSLLDRLF